LARASHGMTTIDSPVSAMPTSEVSGWDVPAPPDLPDLKQTLATRIAAGVKSSGVRDFALRVLDPLPVGDRLCHGDLHPGNVLVASSARA